MAWAPPAPGLSQEAESLSAEVRGIVIQTKSLHLGSLSSYDMKEAKIKVEANVFCKSESDLSCFTDSALQKKKKCIFFARFSSGSKMLLCQAGS